MLTVGIELSFLVFGGENVQVYGKIEAFPINVFFTQFTRDQELHCDQ